VKLLVGLGNPGREYRDTRHNVGFMVIDELARRHQLTLSMAPSQVPETFLAKQYGEAPLLVAKPLTFMNRSGDSVAALMRYYDVDIGDLLVIVDEVALPFGRLRARCGDRLEGTTASSRSSSGWHHGLCPVAAGRRTRG